MRLLDRLLNTRTLGGAALNLRLGIAFIVVATILAAAVGTAIYTYRRMAESAQRTSGELLPELLATLRLSERSAQLTVAVPLLNGATSEKEYQADILIKAGCDHAPGYFFTRPLPAKRIPALLAANRLGNATG